MQTKISLVISCGMYRTIPASVCPEYVLDCLELTQNWLDVRTEYFVSLPYNVP